MSAAAPRPPVSLRPAGVADAGAINEIYNHYVVNSTCTFQTEPSTDEERRTWIEARGPEHPVIVAQEGPVIVGWGALSAFHPRQAYSPTVADAVYVRDAERYRGIGTTILARLVELAREQAHHTIVARISADEEPSRRLHSRFGFREVGRLVEVGRKFGRWLDVVYVQLSL
jgi:phosphinothricin acetyltransferase